jgi:hypothetical protein
MRERADAPARNGYDRVMPRMAVVVLAALVGWLTAESALADPVGVRFVRFLATHGGWPEAVAAAGDVNGDGHQDVIFGARFAHRGGAAMWCWARSGLARRSTSGTSAIVAP